MEDFNIPSDGPNQDKAVFSSTHFGLGKTSLILGIMGLILTWSSLFVFYLIAGAAGGLDLMGSWLDRLLEWLLFARFLGLFLGITGGILGAFSLARRQNKGMAIISLGIGVLMTCTCGVITSIMMMLR